MRYRAILVAVITVLSVLGCWSGHAMADPGFDSPAPQVASSPRQDDDGSEKVVVVLQDGTEISGTVVEESDDKIKLRTAFGISTIDRSRIKEVRRQANPDRAEFDERFGLARRLKDVVGLLDVGEWARTHGMEVEWRRALEAALELEPDNLAARKAFGHARLDGGWVDSLRVEELLARGYRLEGLELVKETGAPVPAKDAGRPAKSTPKTFVKKLSPSELRKIQRQREKRLKDGERFRKQKEEEYRGVPWKDRYRLNGDNYIVVCDSTGRVAKTYLWIMEELFHVLSTRFTGKPTHLQKSTVTIYKNHDEFMSRTGMRPGVGGFYSPGDKGIRAYHGTFGLTGTTFSVLAHEGTHQFQGRMLTNMSFFPIWFIEGMAVYFGDGSRLDRRKQSIVTGLIPRDRLFHIQDKMTKGTYSKLRSLIAMGRNRFGGSQYADSWSLIYFFFDGPDRKTKGLPLMIEYWILGNERSVNPTDFSRLAEKYYGSMEELEKQWVEHTLDLQPEPAGEVEGDYFASDEFKFEVKLPVERWSYVLEGLENDTLVQMEVPNTEARIKVRFLNKADPDQSAEAFIGELEGKMKAKYAEITREKTTIAFQDGFKLTYVDLAATVVDDEGKKEGGGEQPKPAGSDPNGRGVMAGQDDKKGAGEEGQEAPVIKKYRSHILVGVSKAYVITGECPIAEFPQFEAEFDQVAKDFELILQNRW